VAGDYNNSDDLKAVLDALGIEKAVILGCSMGGSAAINFTLQNPQRVLALIPICAGVDGFEVEDTADSEAQWQQAVDAEKQKDFDRYAEIIVHLWIDGPRRKPEEVNPAVRAFVKDMLQTSLDTPEGLGNHIRPTPPAVERLREIHTPTLVIAGKEDVPEMAPYAAKLAAEIPGARLVVLANAGHLPNLERPAEFNRLLEGFLNDVLGGGEK
ncbi:alpha/beta fold hydrolase, partial [bacterium]